MENLSKIAKFFLIFIIALTAINLLSLGYTFLTVSKAMDATLDSIAMLVAEENCIDSSTRSNDVKTIMVNNCPLWLSYNDVGIKAIKGSNGTDILGYAPGSPTSLQQDIGYSSSDLDAKRAEAINHLNYDLLELDSNGNSCESYETCPQRGQPITVKLTGYYKFRLMWPWAINADADPGERTAGGIYLNIPITREVTVVGMKFYKGKEA